jgi:hypothetical protein
VVQAPGKTMKHVAGSCVLFSGGGYNLCVSSWTDRDCITSFGGEGLRGRPEVQGPGKTTQLVAGSCSFILWGG